MIYSYASNYEVAFLGDSLTARAEHFGGWDKMLQNKKILNMGGGGPQQNR